MGIDGGPKACIRCGVSKPLSEFYVHPTCADGHIGECKTCKRAYAREHNKLVPPRERRRVLTRAQKDRINTRRREQRSAKRAMLNPPMQVTKHPLYGRFMAMHRRCSNPSVDAFPYYGGRGIRVCDRWNSFEAFLSDMGTPPTASMQIDRIDNSGDYQPDNCGWATRSENSRNRRPKGTCHVS